MRAIYLESSSALAWLLGEPNTNKILSILNKAEVVATSVLTLIEIERSLIWQEKKGMLKAADRQRLKGSLRQVSVGWTQMEITEEVQAKAKEAFPKEPVRSLDAIHLATMLEFLEVFPDLEILSQDKRILNNLESLGLKLTG